MSRHREFTGPRQAGDSFVGRPANWALLAGGAGAATVFGAVGLVLDLTWLAGFGLAVAVAVAVAALVAGRRLLTQTHASESESARLTAQLITAEQDERRRLSILLHDGPVQSMSGIALMHDAALAAIEDGSYEDAAKVVRASLERERDTIRALRDLTFAIEPLVLRDHGFAAAVGALQEQIERSSQITVSASVEPAERVSEKAQVALYQIVREALTQAVRRRPERIHLTVSRLEDGGLLTEVVDDGLEERRRASIEAIEERVRVLNGRLTVEPGEEGGTVIRVVVPAYVATPAG